MLGPLFDEICRETWSDMTCKCSTYKVADHVDSAASKDKALRRVPIALQHA